MHIELGEVEKRMLYLELKKVQGIDYKSAKGIKGASMAKHESK